jgi:hypothetical protein
MDGRTLRTDTAGHCAGRWWRSWRRAGAERALGDHDQDDEKPEPVATLLEAERVAPEEIHYHVVVRELLRELLKRDAGAPPRDCAH